MTEASLQIDSTSIGNPARFRTFDELERDLLDLPPAADNVGRVAMIVRKGEGGRRELLDGARLSPEAGVPGDAWGRVPEPNPAAQLAVMQLDVAKLIANGQPLTLFGDNLFLEMDLSAGNLPIGSQVRAGGAVLEVTPKPHNGCAKFQARFGREGLRFVSAPVLRHRNLRGIYLRVIEAGPVAVGDAVEVLVRASERVIEPALVRALATQSG